MSLALLSEICTDKCINVFRERKEYENDVIVKNI